MPAKIFCTRAATVWLPAELAWSLPESEFGPQRQADSSDATDSARAAEEPLRRSKKTVELTIDYGDGVQKRFLTIPWKKEMTVEAALRFAQSHKRGIKVRSQGQGATALLLQIDDLKNQGGQGLNWIFRVNGELGKTSYATAKLQSGDRVLWKFDVYK